MAEKEYIKIFAIFTQDGKVIPKSFLFSDGNVYKIDRITDIRRKASLKTGGSGIRYTVMIGGNERYIFRDGDIWYMETEHA